MTPMEIMKAVMDLNGTLTYAKGPMRSRLRFAITPLEMVALRAYLDQGTADPSGPPMIASIMGIRLIEDKQP